MISPTLRLKRLRTFCLIKPGHQVQEGEPCRERITTGSTASTALFSRRPLRLEPSFGHIHTTEVSMMSATKAGFEPWVLVGISVLAAEKLMARILWFQF